VLVNCAGIAPAAKTAGRNRETGEPRTYDLGLFEKAISINLVGTFRCIAKLSAGMMTLEPLDAQGSRGATSTPPRSRGRTGQISQASSAASKAGVLAMTPPLTRHLINEGIRVNTILPGNFESPMMAGMPKRVQGSIAAMAPFPKRLGKAAEYAECALFLLGHDHMNGECVRPDDMIHMGRR